MYVYAHTFLTSLKVIIFSSFVQSYNLLQFYGLWPFALNSLFLSLSIIHFEPFFVALELLNPFLLINLIHIQTEKTTN